MDATRDTPNKKPRSAEVSRHNTILSGIFSNGKIWRLIRKHRGRQQDAPDVMQDLMVKLGERKDLVDLKDPVTYAMRAVKNLLTDRLRREASHHVEQHDPLEVVAESELLDSSAPERSVQAQLDLKAALTGLPQLTCQILVLHKCEGMGYHEIARQVGRSRATVQTHIEKAKAHLAQWHERQECEQ